jgi:hypothetical protein
LQVSLRLQGCQSAVAGRRIQRLSGCEAEQVACVAGCRSTSRSKAATRARRLAALRWVLLLHCPSFFAGCGPLVLIFTSHFQYRREPPNVPPRPGCAAAALPAPRSCGRPRRCSRALFKRAHTNLRHSYRKHQNVQSQSKLSLSSRNRVCCCQWAEECCASGAGSQCCPGQEPRGRLRVADSRKAAGDAVSDPRIWRLVLPGWRLRCL